MGSVYSIKSRTCITRVNKHKVHVLVTFQVAFTKSGLISCKLKTETEWIIILDSYYFPFKKQSLKKMHQMNKFECTAG